MYEFYIPIRKLDRDVAVRLESDDDLRDNAFHGIKQRLNDALAGHKRADFKSDEEFEKDGMTKVGKVLERIESGTVGHRESADPKKAAARKLVASLAANPELLAKVIALVSGEAAPADEPEADDEAADEAAA